MSRLGHGGQQVHSWGERLSTTPQARTCMRKGGTSLDDPAMDYWPCEHKRSDAVGMLFATPHSTASLQYKLMHCYRRSGGYRCYSTSANRSDIGLPVCKALQETSFRRRRSQGKSTDRSMETCILLFLNGTACSTSLCTELAASPRPSVGPRG